MLTAVVNGILLKRRWYNFLVLILPFRALVENVDIDVGIGPVNRKAKFVLGCWLIMSIIITYGYRGLLTSDITAPKPVNGPKNLQDILTMDIMVQWKTDQETRDGVKNDLRQIYNSSEFDKKGNENLKRKRANMFGHLLQSWFLLTALQPLLRLDKDTNNGTNKEFIIKSKLLPKVVLPSRN